VTDSFSLLGLLVSLLTPWLFGGLLLRRWLGRGWHWALIAGHGFLLGYLLITVVMRLWDALGLKLAFWPIVGMLAVMAGVLLGLKRGAQDQDGVLANTPQEASRSPRVLKLGAVLLLGLAAVHWLSAVWEIVQRPLYPWDAWSAWVPKTVQFFHARSLDFELVTIGAKHAETVNVIHLWSMLGTGVSAHPLLQLPWAMAFLALLLGVFGHARHLGFSVPVAALTCYLVSSLPYVGIHAALAGYADLWVLLAFSLSVMALSLRDRRLIWVVPLYIVACVSIKRAGVGMAGILLLCLLAPRMWFGLKALRRQLETPRSRQLLALLGGEVLIVAGLVIFVGMTFRVPLPGLAPLEISGNIVTLSWAGVYELNYEPIWEPLWQNLYLSANWHLLYYLLPVGIVAVVVTRHWSLVRQPLVVAPLLGLVFGASFHALVQPWAAYDQTGLTRALMYSAPGLVLWLVLVVLTLSRAPGSHSSEPGLQRA